MLTWFSFEDNKASHLKGIYYLSPALCNVTLHQRENKIMSLLKIANSTMEGLTPKIPYLEI